MNIVSRNNNNSNNNNNVSSGSSNNNNNQACAACKYQRKKCATDCVLAPYFPHDRQRQFLNAHKLFGVKKITKIIKHLAPLQKDQAMGSIIYQSDMRANDPVGGCYRYIQDLQNQIKYHQAELELVLQQLAVFRSQDPHHHHHHHHLNNLYNNPNNIIAPGVVPPTANHHHYQYLEQEPYNMMVHHDEQEEYNQNSSDVVSNLQDDVSSVCWAVQDSSGCLSSLTLQNKNIVGDDDHIYVGDDELYHNDQKSSSTSMLDHIHCGDDDHERNEIGFEPRDLVDRSDEGVLFKIENAVSTAEADDCIEQDQDQDHDLKGAATLFTLTNCTT